MTLKPPTRTLPRLVMKDWPDPREGDEWAHVYIDKGTVYVNGVSDKAPPTSLE